MSRTWKRFYEYNALNHFANKMAVTHAYFVTTIQITQSITRWGLFRANNQSQTPARICNASRRPFNTHTSTWALAWKPLNCNSIQLLHYKINSALSRNEIKWNKIKMAPSTRRHTHTHTCKHAKHCSRKSAINLVILWRKSLHFEIRSYNTFLQRLSFKLMWPAWCNDIILLCI